jgi:hypothetical protein
MEVKNWKFNFYFEHDKRKKHVGLTMTMKTKKISLEEFEILLSKEAENHKPDLIEVLTDGYYLKKVSKK